MRDGDLVLWESNAILQYAADSRPDPLRVTSKSRPSSRDPTAIEAVLRWTFVDAESLGDITVLLIDCQTTGATPAHGHLLEVGWAVHRGGEDPKRRPIEVVSRLVRLPSPAVMPRRVAGLTGLQSHQLAAAPTPEAVWRELLDRTRDPPWPRSPVPTVAHCASFEARFLRPLHESVAPSAPFPLAPICTLEIARRTHPNLPRRGLRALAGFFGHDVGPLRRAEEHVRATAVVWHRLIIELARRNVASLGDLERFLRAPAPRRRRLIYPMSRQARLRLPDRPGVYRLQRPGGDVLYVGKASSLRARVNSYFQQQSSRSERMLELLSQAQDIEVTATETTLEAAVLESDEIKRLAPPYNVALQRHGRAPWFATPGVAALSPRTSRRHLVGPLGSPWWFSRLHGLWAAIAAPSDAAARDGLGRALGPSVAAAAASVLREALDAFARQGDLPPGDPRAVLALGTRWGRAPPPPTALDRHAPFDPHTPGDPAAPPWWAAEAGTPDPTEIQRQLTDVVVAAAHALRRARWLRWMSESTVAWHERGRWHGLMIRGGQIADRLPAPSPGALPSPPDGQRPLRARRRSFDLATFDRLRVLTTELRRLVEAGHRAEIKLDPRRTLRGERLRRVLAAV